MKIFGSYSGAAHLAAKSTRGSGKKQKTRNPLKTLAIVLAVLVFVEICYFTCVYSQNAFITKWRNIYIETAMDTLNHKWLATSIIPEPIISEVMNARQETLNSAVGMESGWNTPGDTEPDVGLTPEDEEDDGPIHMDTTVNEVTDETPDEKQARLREEFLQRFDELDPESLDAWVADHPEAIANGWDKLYINEAGLDDEGTTIKTKVGDQVLAIDAVNDSLLLRVKGSGYIGVLAIAKDPSRISVRPSSQLGVTGETTDVIAKANNGLIAITGGGFDDPNGNGNGGKPAGYVMCDGEVLNPNHCPYGYKRIEIHENNLMYINDVGSKVSDKVTDAVEFIPALIIDGRVIVDANCGYTGLHPRTCIGQNDDYEYLMLVIEGRMPLRSLGTDVIECADILMRYGCMQGMNLDGGTSTMMYYDGELITKCSNGNLPKGRTLPNAFVYAYANEE